MSQEKKALDSSDDKQSKRIRKTPNKYEDYETSKKTEESLFQVTDIKEVEGIKKQSKMVDKKQLLERLKKLKNTVLEETKTVETIKESNIENNVETINTKETITNTKTENGVTTTEKSMKEETIVKPEVKSKPVKKTTPSKKKKEREEEENYEPNILTTKKSPKEVKRPQRKKPKFEENIEDLKSDIQLCYKLLQEIKKDEWAWPFSEPVDIVALNIPDYYSVIKFPMDLRTVETNIFTNKYETIQQFATDMRRIWTNCYTYNPPDSDVSLMAKKLDNMFEEKFKKLIETTDSSFYKNKVIEMEQQLSSMKEKLEKTETEDKKEEIVKKKKPIRVQSIPITTNSTSTNLDLKQMTFDEKKKLSDNISRLDSNKLAKVVEIIQSRAPKASSQATETEIEIDLDKLDNVTLRQIERHVKSALTKSRSKKKNVNIEKNVQINNVNEKKENKKNGEETESSEGESTSGEETNSDTDEEKEQTNGEKFPKPLTKGKMTN